MMSEINFKQGEDLAFFTFSEKNISINVQNGFNHQNAGIELSEDHTKQLVEFINKPSQQQNQELLELVKIKHDAYREKVVYAEVKGFIQQTLAKWGGDEI